ncbi:MAG: HD-GYP domain-containing protein [Betaproteobacteria bacterium]
MNRIVQLSESHDVVASEDIFDTSGMKLLAKGKRVSAELQNRLLQRKLARPLEMALSVESAVSVGDVVTSCLEQLDILPLTKCFAGSQSAMALLKTLKDVKLAPPVRLLLTAIHQHSPEEYSHNLITILIAVGIASRLRATDHDAMVLMLSGLLHDFGLLYVNPELVKSTYRLGPAEWKYVAAHPLIGQLMIKELTALPPLVGECIALHHERLDGSGYPNYVDINRTHRLGAWLAVADSVSAIMARGGDEAPTRIALALRVIPEEFDREAVGAVLQSMRGMGVSVGSGDKTCFDRAEQEMERLERAQELIRERLAKKPDPMFATIGEALLITLGNVAKSLRATGVLDARKQLMANVDDADLLAEMNQITFEVGWRMRNLARNVHLRAEAAGGANLVAQCRDVIVVLDESSAQTETAVPAGTSPEAPATPASS